MFSFFLFYYLTFINRNPIYQRREFLLLLLNYKNLFLINPPLCLLLLSNLPLFLIFLSIFRVLLLFDHTILYCLPLHFFFNLFEHQIVLFLFLLLPVEHTFDHILNYEMNHAPIFAKIIELEITLAVLLRILSGHNYCNAVLLKYLRENNVLHLNFYFQLTRKEGFWRAKTYMIIEKIKFSCNWFVSTIHTGVFLDQN